MGPPSAGVGEEATREPGRGRHRPPLPTRIRPNRSAPHLGLGGTGKMASRYARVPQAVWQDPRLSYAEFKTLVCLIGYANKDGRCWPAIATIAQELGRARSTVSGHLEALIGHGYLEKFPQRRPDGGQKANIYLLKLPPSDEPTGGCPATREPTRRAEQQSFLLPISSAAGSSDRGVSGGQRGPAGPDPAPPRRSRSDTHKAQTNRTDQRTPPRRRRARGLMLATLLGEMEGCQR